MGEVMTGVVSAISEVPGHPDKVNVLVMGERGLGGIPTDKNSPTLPAKGDEVEVMYMGHRYAWPL